MLLWSREITVIATIFTYVTITQIHRPKKVNHSIQKQLQKECIASVTKFTHVMQDWIATDPQSSSISDDNNKSEQKTERTTSHSNV